VNFKRFMLLMAALVMAAVVLSVLWTVDIRQALRLSTTAYIMIAAYLRHFIPGSSTKAAPHIDAAKIGSWVACI
jgi:hypothetical protein